MNTPIDFMPVEMPDAVAPANQNPAGMPLENYSPQLVTDPDGSQWAINPDGTKQFLGKRNAAEAHQILASTGNASTGAPFTGGFQRQPVAPPQNAGGVPMPDLSRIYQTAFSRFPPDQAMKAAKAATAFRVRNWAQQAMASGMDSSTVIRNSMLMLAENERDLAEIAKTLPRQPTPLQEAETGLAKARTKALENPRPGPDPVLGELLKEEAMAAAAARKSPKDTDLVREANEARYRVEEYRKANSAGQQQPQSKPVVMPAAISAPDSSAPPLPAGTTPGGLKYKIITPQAAPVIPRPVVPPAPTQPPAPAAAVAPVLPVGSPARPAPMVRPPTTPQPVVAPTLGDIVGLPKSDPRRMAYLNQQRNKAAQNAATSQRETASKKAVADFESTAQSLRYGGMDDPAVVAYLSKFNPQQKAAQLRALQQRIEQLRNQQQ